MVADLELFQAVDNDSPADGDNVTFTLTVNNEGPDDTTGVSVQNQLPSGFTFVIDDANGGYDPLTGIWTIGFLGNGVSQSVDITTEFDPVLYRVNAGGPEIPSTDGGPNWSADTDLANSIYLVGNAGISGTVEPITLNGSVPVGTPAPIFQQERFDLTADLPNMQWQFPVSPNTEVEVRLYFAETFAGITAPGQRVFDVAVEGDVPAAFDNIDPFGNAGGLNTGFLLTDTVTVTDGALNLEFIGIVENPTIKAIEIVAVGTPASSTLAQVLTSDQPDPDSTPGNGFIGEDDDTASEVVEPPTPQTIELFRFRNTNFDTGTYVFVGQEERDAILADPDLSGSFELDGRQPDGSINPAFTASTQSGDDLLPFFRLRSLETPGTFLFVSTQEYDAIFAEGSNQQNSWEKEGLDAEGNDIPEFYLFGVGAGQGTVFNRFQNLDNNTFLYAGPEETASINGNPDLAAIFSDQGGAFGSL